MHFCLALAAASAALVAASPTPDDLSKRLLRPVQQIPKHSVAPSSGCGRLANVTVEQLMPANITIETADNDRGRHRTFAYWLPPGYDPNTPSPVIFSFHGGDDNAPVQAKISELWQPHFNKGNYVVIYPESTADRAGRNWQVSPLVAHLGVDDMAYVDAVLNRVTHEFCLDENRVYATGISQGAGMANMLACHPVLSNRFAAFAPVAGSYFYQYPDMPADFDWQKAVDDPARDETKVHCHPRDDILPCEPGRRDIPIMAFHGAADEAIRYGGMDKSKHLSCTPGINYYIAEWARRDEFDPEDYRTSRLTSDGPAGKKLGGDAIRYVYGERSDPRGLVNLVWHGGGHVWPKAYGVDGNAAFNATSMIIDFFDRFALNDEDPRNRYIKIPGKQAPPGITYGRPDAEMGAGGASFFVMLETAFISLLELLHLA